jgi:hypothetical protein
MISMIKAILGFLLLCAVPGVIMGLISSYRAGQKPHEPVFLRLKKFAQWEKWPCIWRHVKHLWPYYGLVIVLALAALSK